MTTKEQVETEENEKKGVGRFAVLRVVNVSGESTARESPLVVLMDKSPAGRYSVLFGLGPCTPVPPSLSL